MALLDDESVREVYRGVLGREPESQSVVDHYASSGMQLADLIRAFLNSGEYREKYRNRSVADLLYDGMTPADEALLRRHLVRSQPDPDHLINFLGVRLRHSLMADTMGRGGTCYNEIPTLIGDIHAEPAEYVGVIKAVEAGSGPFVAVELGAGIGTWSVISGHLARRLGRDPIRLYAVEGSTGRMANMRIHFEDNGFDPDAHRLVNAIVGPSDGYALFPIVDVLNNWGGEAVFTTDDADRPGYEKLPSISLATLLRDETLIDLAHFDIQGAEGDVIPAAIDTLTAKVRYMVVATHGRDIEARLIRTMAEAGWLFENESVARIDRSGGGTDLRIDGTLIWRNPRIA